MSLKRLVEVKELHCVGLPKGKFILILTNTEKKYNLAYTLLKLY